MNYGSLFSHRLMVRDSVRTEAFHRAIRAVVRPGGVVLDIGAGTGILSLLAARAGAARVYAIEPTSVAPLIGKLAARNGLGGVIRVIQAPIEVVSLGEKVDVIVSEWLGSIGVDENLLPSVLVGRDRFLKPGGRMIPSRVTAFLTPGRLAMRADVRFFEQQPYGLDLGLLAEPSIHELMMYRRRVAPGDVVGIPAQLWTTEPGTMKHAALLPFRAAVRFTFSQPTTINCLLAWFQAELAGGVSLSNAPDAPDTHWGQLLLPLDRELSLAPAADLRVHITCIPSGPLQSHLVWSVRAGDGAWEHHDTRCFNTAPESSRLDAGYAT